MISPITAVWILAVPLREMDSVMLLHLSQRKKAFAADLQHMPHVLLKVGYSVNQVVMEKTGLSFLRGEIAIATERNGSPEAVMSFELIERWGAWGVYVAASRRLQRLQVLARCLVFPLSAWYGAGLA